MKQPYNPFKQLPLAAALSLSLLTTGAVADIKWEYSYNELGQITQVDGPRTEVTDTTDYKYYSQDDQGTSADSSQFDLNRLKTVTNALGHITTLSEYNAYGLPRKLVDPRGTTMTLGYDALGQLTRYTVQAGTDANTELDAETRLGYNRVGLLTTLTLPDGSGLNFEYDSARRLTAVENSLGERIEYTLDSMGNSTAVNVSGTDSALQLTLSRTFDELGRLLTQTGANVNETSQFSYNTNSSLTGLSDANLSSTTQTFDALQRLTTQTDAIGKIVTLNYDQHYNLTSVNVHYDAGKVAERRDLTTTYEYDAYNRVIKRISPDSGTMAYGYDEAGNIKTRTDERGITAEYRYDALNRLTEKRYTSQNSPDTAEVISYTYDQPPADTSTVQTAHTGIGQLTQISDALGSDRFSYDHRGNLLQQRRTTAYGSHLSEYNLGYQWDKADRLNQITYPSGLSVSYQRNSAGQVADIRYQFDGKTTTVASDIAYQAFGGVNSLTWGNGLNLSRTYDQNGRIAQQQISSLDTLNYEYDLVGNLERIDRPDDARQPDQPFTYDAIDRLTSEDGVYGSREYKYDALGNRTTRSWEKFNLSGGSKILHQRAIINKDSNQLKKNGGRDVIYSGTGDILTGNQRLQHYSYNLQGKYSTFTNGNVLQGSYAYNGFGERILKQRPTLKTDQLIEFQYNPSGQLLSEARFNANGLHRVDVHYIWLDQLPVALVELYRSKAGKVLRSELYYLHSDHLNTPRFATNSEQTEIWHWDSDAFGMGKENSNPDKDRRKISINLRFPGQYFDSESGLHYNYYRDYDPRTGRYIQSDPIGLAGGLNTYAYSKGNPVRFYDPYGLDVYGLNFGAAGTFGIKTAYSYQVLLDTEGNFGIQRTKEIGGGLGGAAGVFGNLLYGTPDNMHDLEGWGGSLSGSAWFLGGAVNLPIATDYQQNNCGEFKSFEASTPGMVYEAGLALSIGTPEVGVTGTYTDTVFSTSILGDIGRWIGSTAYDVLH
ncbi:RHS repeat-associated core domain-containing protein [Amphritea sp. HPY]|uniref:RHS repeat-associated core domain-containing protein n=1 Tax=Amphritea sp. HPY TaxID=3421652 RepID=UPI003D7E2FA6